MKKNVLLVSILVLVVFTGFGANLLSRSHFLNNCQNYIIKGNKFCLIVAQTPKQRQTGLMNIQTLANSKGALFVFNEKGIYPFWNKNTFVNLDVIWVNQGKIVAIEYLPKFDKKPVTINPNEVADRVIELKAGTSRRLGLSIGEQVEGLYGSSQ